MDTQNIEKVYFLNIKKIRNIPTVIIMAGLMISSKLVDALSKLRIRRVVRKGITKTLAIYKIMAGKLDYFNILLNILKNYLIFFSAALMNSKISPSSIFWVLPISTSVLWSLMFW